VRLYETGAAYISPFDRFMWAMRATPGEYQAIADDAGNAAVYRVVGETIAGGGYPLAQVLAYRFPDVFAIQYHDGFGFDLYDAHPTPTVAQARAQWEKTEAYASGISFEEMLKRTGTTIQADGHLSLPTVPVDWGFGNKPDIGSWIPKLWMAVAAAQFAPTFSDLLSPAADAAPIVETSAEISLDTLPADVVSDTAIDATGAGMDDYTVFDDWGDTVPDMGTPDIPTVPDVTMPEVSAPSMPYPTEPPAPSVPSLPAPAGVSLPGATDWKSILNTAAQFYRTIQNPGAAGRIDPRTGRTIPVNARIDPRTGMPMLDSAGNFVTQSASPFNISGVPPILLYGAIGVGLFMLARKR